MSSINIILKHRRFTRLQISFFSTSLRQTFLLTMKNFTIPKSIFSSFLKNSSYSSFGCKVPFFWTSIRQTYLLNKKLSKRFKTLKLLFLKIIKPNNSELFFNNHFWKGSLNKTIKSSLFLRKKKILLYCAPSPALFSDCIKIKNPSYYFLIKQIKVLGFT